MAKNFYVSTLGLLLTAAMSQTMSAQTASDSKYLRDPMPERWTFTQEMTQTLPTDDSWWRSFGDTTLDSLIAMGVDNNFNVQQAVHRREIARQAIRDVRSGYYPTVNANAGYTRSRKGGVNSDAYSLGIDAAWEVDVFGKIYSQVKAKKAAYNVSRADYLATMVSMTAEIVKYYFNYRVLQAHISVTNEHIQYQKRVVEITEARHEAGLVSKLDVTQAKTVDYNTEAQLPSLEAQELQTLNALSILIGVYPHELKPLLERHANLPPYQQIVPTGVPADLLRRRPDVVEAEATLAQYAAQVGVAKKDFLPTLSIQGSIGWGGDRVDNMFGRDNFSFSVGPRLSWTIFEGFSRGAALATAREQMQVGIDAYNLTVMTAVSEVENAIASYNAAIKSLNLNSEVFNQSRESFDISMEQYKQGLSAFTNVVDAQIDWLNCARSLVSAHGDALIALVDLYKALGGSPIYPE